MKNRVMDFSFMFLGGIVGCYFAVWADLTGWNLLWEIFYGAFIGLSFALAWEQKEPYMILGCVIGLIISFSVDYFAGSKIYTADKLIYAFLCMFVAWYLKPILKFVLFGGFLGGMIGFILGMLQSHWFGTICLPAGFLNATLTSVRFSIIGMACGSLFVKAGGTYLIDKLRWANIK